MGPTLFRPTKVLNKFKYQSLSDSKFKIQNFCRPWAVIGDIGELGDMGEIGVSASYNSTEAQPTTDNGQAEPQPNTLGVPDGTTEAHPQTLNKGAAPQFAWRK